MKVKEKVLELLLEAEGKTVSGQEMAERLQVSRNAVWKAIQALQKEGYWIEGVTKKGYVLLKESSRLSEAVIRNHLKKEYRHCPIHIYKELDSTNMTLKQLAEEGAPEGTIVLAEMQKEGRGRMGRVFYSPAETGLYMSMLLRPNLPVQDLQMITAAAAVAAAEALEATAGIETKIKWVNDVYAHGKKVSGILTEASLSIETGSVDFVIVGIGVNVMEPEGGFPKRLKKKAGALCKEGEMQEGIRNLLAGEIVTRFFDFYHTFPKYNFLDAYKSRSFVVGKEIIVHKAEGDIKAKALGVDDKCGLHVVYGNGQHEILRSGEISACQDLSESCSDIV